MANRNCVDMTQGPILRKLLTFAFPLMLNYLVNILYQTADSIIAGQFLGANAMAAVGATGAPFGLIIGFFSGIGGCVPILCGNYIGKRDQKALRECMHTAPALGALLGVAVCLLGLLLRVPLLHSTNTPEEIFADALLYLNIRLFSIPLTLCNIFCAGILSAHGDTKRISAFGLFSGFTNLVGNILFVTLIPLGVAGLALATNLSNLVYTVLLCSVLLNTKDNYGLKFSELKLHLHQTKELLALGLPGGLSNLMFSFSSTLTQSGINTFGAAVIAGNTAADTIDQFTSIFPTQMQVAISCAAAQCYGAGNIRRIHETTKKGILGNVLTSTLVCITLTVFSKPLISIFVDDPAVIAAGVEKLTISCWGSVIYSISLVYNATLRGMQKPTRPLIVNLLSVCLFRILWIWFVLPLFKTTFALYLVFPLSYAISATLMAITYHREHRALLANQSKAV